MKRNSIASLVAVVVIIAMAMFSGCVEEEQVLEMPQAEISLTTYYMDKISSGAYHLYPKLDDPLIEFDVTNDGADVLEVTVSSEISGYTDKAINLEQIAPGETNTILQTPLFKPGVLDTLTELKTANLHYKVTYLEDGEEMTWDEQTIPVELYAKDTMIWGVMVEDEYVNLQPLIAAWVTPHAREVDELVRVAAEYHPQRSMGAAETPEERYEQVGAIYYALQNEYMITYISSTISYAGQTESSQRVKLPKDAINLASANCIDGTVLFASALENIEIDPYIVMIPGHAFLAWDAGDGTISCLETTMVNSATFEEALDVGYDEYDQEIENGNFDAGVSSLISIKDAREIGITPMQ